MEAEVAALLAAYADHRTATGRRRLVRHGHGPEGEILTGSGRFRCGGRKCGTGEAGGRIGSSFTRRSCRVSRARRVPWTRRCRRCICWECRAGTEPDAPSHRFPYAVPTRDSRRRRKWRLIGQTPRSRSGESSLTPAPEAWAAYQARVARVAPEE